MARCPRRPRAGEPAARPGRSPRTHRPGAYPVAMGSGSADRLGSVLVVDAEPASRERLRRVLEAEGCEVRLASDEGEAMQVLEEIGAPDVAILDAPGPATAGLRLCRRLRRRYLDLPLLLISAAKGIEDRVAGIRAGADDHIGKPVAAEEVAATVQVLLRTGAHRLRAALHHGTLELNRATWQAYHAGERLKLTRTEFDLLELFLLHPGEVLHRAFIYERVWGYGVEYHSNSLEVYVSSLRRKLERHGRPRLIHTVRSVGYVLRDEPR